jgi:hypothetical protein
LVAFSEACRYAYVVAQHPDAWRELTLQELGPALKWHGSWIRTFAASRVSQPFATLKIPTPVVIRGVYSDLLYQWYACLTSPLKRAWEGGSTLESCSADLSAEEFRQRYEDPGKPVILRGACNAWAAREWTKESLLKRHATTRLRCGAVELPLGEYYAYAEDNEDEAPLFVFDKTFATRAPDLLTEYEVPPVFAGRDLFDLLPPASRPDFRWILIGYRRSGSKWHIDPNMTNAWNAVVKGAKKWMMLPPGVPPPGVRTSHDGGEVVQPVSLAEWFMNNYAEARATGQLREGVCGAGDLVYVPSGWWHAVLNLEDDTIGITQNYVSGSNLAAVRGFLQRKPDQVSGVADRDGLSAAFEAALKEHRPDLLGDSGAAAVKEMKSAEPDEGGGSFWDRLRNRGKPLAFSRKA